tara:strand:+ start:68 stop:1021 length:954 start_codon:yes stop_codon:yes gene_type:complete
MNKKQKAVRDSVSGYTLSPEQWALETDDYKEFRKTRKMKNTEFKEYRSNIDEGKFSKALIDKAIKIAKKSSGQMTKAFVAIEKIKKGLGDDPLVAKALQLANEDLSKIGEVIIEHPNLTLKFKDFRDGTRHTKEHTEALVENKEMLEENYRQLATKGMGTETKKSIKVGTEVDYYDTKNGDKHMGVITKIDGKGYEVIKVDDRAKKEKFTFYDRDKAKKILGESVFVSEAKAKYKIDHKTFSGAVEEAMSVATKAKYEVDEDSYFHEIATGPRKPGEGKTNTYKIDLSKNGKIDRKKLQIQIYGKGKHGYELNCYIA